MDEDGKEINPHIPQYMSTSPWYLSQGNGPTLKHQRNWKINTPSAIKVAGESAATANNWYDRGSKTFQAKKFRKGACTKYVVCLPTLTPRGGTSTHPRPARFPFSYSFSSLSRCRSR